MCVCRHCLWDSATGDFKGNDGIAFYPDVRGGSLGRKVGVEWIETWLADTPPVQCADGTWGCNNDQGFAHDFVSLQGPECAACEHNVCGAAAAAFGCPLKLCTLLV